MKKTKISIIIAIAILQTISMLSVIQPAAFAEKIEGDEGPNTLIGTPGNDKIDSKGGNDFNSGDPFEGVGSGNDKINSGDGNDENVGDAGFGGSGDDKINSGKGKIAILETPSMGMALEMIR